jgi:hypothetical protein
LVSHALFAADELSIVKVNDADFVGSATDVAVIVGVL